MINEFKNNRNLNLINYVNDCVNEITKFLLYDFNNNWDNYNNLIHYINDYNDENAKFI